MNKRHTEQRQSQKTVIEVVTDCAHVPDDLKLTLQQAGVDLLAVHVPSTRPQPLRLRQGEHAIVVLLADELPESWMDIVLQQPGERVLFLDWDGAALQPSMRALIHKLQITASQPESESDIKPAAKSAPVYVAQMPSTWLLASSIGGPEAMRSFLSRLPGDLPACLLLAQHIGREFQDQLVKQLDSAGALPVRLLQDGMLHEPGQVLVVPSDCQVRLVKGRFQLKQAQQRFTPCIDQVVAGLLPQLGERLGMIVFSGMSNDGVAGSHAIHVAGGPVWVQTPETCVVASMVEGTMQKTETGLTGSPAELADMLVSVYQ